MHGFTFLACFDGVLSAMETLGVSPGDAVLVSMVQGEYGTVAPAVVLTGHASLERTKVRKLLRSFGIYVHDHVAPNTDTVVNSNPAGRRTIKVSEADRLGVPILTEQAFSMMLLGLVDRRVAGHKAMYDVDADELSVLESMS